MLLLVVVVALLTSGSIGSRAQNPCVSDEDCSYPDCCVNAKCEVCESIFCETDVDCPAGLCCKLDNFDYVCRVC